MKLLRDYTDKKYIKWIKSRNKYKAIEELALVFKNTPVCSEFNELVSGLVDREKIMSTGIGFGIAIPHVKIQTVNEITFAVGISKNGIEFESLDGLPVNIIILMAAGERQHKEYLKLLSHVMSVLKNEEIRKKIIESRTPDEILKLFNVFLDR